MRAVPDPFEEAPPSSPSAPGAGEPPSLEGGPGRRANLPPASVRRPWPKPSEAVLMAAGIAVILGGAAYALVRAQRTSASGPSVADLPVIPGVTRPSPKAVPPGAGGQRPHPSPKGVPLAAAPAAASTAPPAAAAAAPNLVPGGGIREGTSPPTSPASLAPPGPAVSEPKEPAAAAPTAEAPPVVSPATPPVAAPEAPPATSPETAPVQPPELPSRGGAWAIAGKDAGVVLAQVEKVPPPEDAAAPEQVPRFVVASTPPEVGRPGALSPDPAPPAAARAGGVVEVEPDAIRVVSTPPMPSERDPIADLVPPLGLVGAVLEGTSLPVAPASRGAAVVALARLTARDGVGAAKALEGAVATPGVRVLRAFAALARRELPAVHELLYGLGDDLALGPVARLITGAALRADGNAREAVRDFEAAVRARPAYWPAHLLAGEAYESDDLRLPEKAAAAYGAAADSAPREPAVVLGHAYYRAIAKDAAGARSEVERLLADHADLVPAWRLLSWIRAGSGTSEDLRAAAEALEHVTTLEPADARAWGELGGARWRWGAAGGGPAALWSAAEAFASQTALAPHDGLAWFNRGGTLHQAAVTAPLGGDATSFLARLGQARTCYAKALGSGLARRDAARVHFNVGLLLETLPTLAPAEDGLPSRAADAFASALLADPSYVAAALALVAARIAEKDAAGAAKALADAPPGADPREQAVLEAGVAWIAGDAAKARSALVVGGGVAVDGADPLPALAKALLVLGYRRATVGLLAGAATDVAGLTLRARADAGLRDLAALRVDLDRLATIDPEATAALRAKDPEILAALGPPAPAPRR